MRLDEFFLESLSLPATDADEVPPVCFTCHYLAHKEFSVGGDGLFYYFCAYHWPDRLSRTEPPCLAD
jgi:hypothetical protein